MNRAIAACTACLAALWCTTLLAHQPASAHEPPRAAADAKAGAQAQVCLADPTRRPDDLTPPAQIATKPQPPKDLKAAARQAVAESAFVRRPASALARAQTISQLESLAHRLLDLYDRVEQPAEKLSTSQRERLRIQLRSRLLGLAEVILRRAERAQTAISPTNPQQVSRHAAPLSHPVSLAADAQGGGAVEDLGLELVELIQRTVAPSTWDVNGGQGTIQYYAPWKVLVVRQTGEVHGQLGRVVGQLRR